MVYTFLNSYIVLKTLRSLYDIHITTTQTSPSWIQNPACTTYTSILHNLHLPPNIHNITSITQHTYIHHSIKTQYLPQFTSLPRQAHLYRTMFTWGQSEKYIAEWTHHIRTERLQAPGYPQLLTRHHPNNPEASTCLLKHSCLFKNCTQFDSLPFDLLHNINMLYSFLLYCNKQKPILAQLTQHNPIICMSTSYKTKYVPFHYYMHYYFFQYA